MLATGIGGGCNLLYLKQVLEKIGACCVQTGFEGGLGLLFLQQILEVDEACCGCNIYWKEVIGTAVVVTDIGGVGGCCGHNIYWMGLGTAVVITYIGGGWGLLWS